MKHETDDLRENTRDGVRTLIPPRPADGHKGTFGCCVVVGGSDRYVGAPCFAAASAQTVARSVVLQGEGAMRCGCGTTVLAVPDFLAPALYPTVRCSAIFPLRSDGHRIIFDAAEAEMLTKKATSFVVGCGLGEGGAEGLTEFLLQSWSGNFVLDADGLAYCAAIADFKGRAVLTPHLGEAARLTGRSVESVKARGAEICKELAAEKRAIVVLKGAVSYISDGTCVYINRTGNVKLAKGGSGDLLAGMIGGFLSFGTPPFAAARLGAYLLGKAAELSPVNAVAHLPTDVLNALPAAIDTLSE